MNHPNIFDVRNSEVLVNTKTGLTTGFVLHEFLHKLLLSRTQRKLLLHLSLQEFFEGKLINSTFHIPQSCRTSQCYHLWQPYPNVVWILNLPLVRKEFKVHPAWNSLLKDLQGTTYLPSTQSSSWTFIFQRWVSSIAKRKMQQNRIMGTCCAQLIEPT